MERRHYLSYIRDHHEKLECQPDSSAIRFETLAAKQPLASKLMFDMASNPPFLTKATTVAPERRITSQLLAAERSDVEDEDLRTQKFPARSTGTMSHLPRFAS